MVWSRGRNLQVLICWGDMFFAKKRDCSPTPADCAELLSSKPWRIWKNFLLESCRPPWFRYNSRAVSSNSNSMKRKILCKIDLQTLTALSPSSPQGRITTACALIPNVAKWCVEMHTCTHREIDTTRRRVHKEALKVGKVRIVQVVTYARGICAYKKG